MVFARITGIIIILLGIFIGLFHFNIVSNTLLGFDLIMIGILIFIAHEAYALIRNLSSDGNKLISIGVPLLFIIIAASYFIKAYTPEVIASNTPLIIAALMCAEGLYRLH